MELRRGRASRQVSKHAGNLSTRAAGYEPEASHFMALEPFEIIPSAAAPVSDTNVRSSSWWGRLWNAFTVQFFKLNAAMNLIQLTASHFAGTRRPVNSL